MSRRTITSNNTSQNSRTTSTNNTNNARPNYTSIPKPNVALPPKLPIYNLAQKPNNKPEPVYRPKSTSYGDSSTNNQPKPELKSNPTTNNTTNNTTAHAPVVNHPPRLPPKIPPTTALPPKPQTNAISPTTVHQPPMSPFSPAPVKYNVPIIPPPNRPNQPKTFFTHSSAKHPIRTNNFIKQENSNESTDSRMDIDLDSPVPVTPQSSVTPTSASSIISDDSPPKRTFENHNLPFMSVNTNHSVHVDLMSKLKADLDDQKRRASALEEQVYIERGKATKFEQKADRFDKEIVGLKNKNRDLESALKSRHDDQELRRLRGEVERLKTRLTHADNDQSEKEKTIVRLRKTNEELQLKLEEKEAMMTTPQRKSYATDKETMLQGLDEMEFPPYSPNFDDNSMGDFDSMQSDADRESLVFEGNLSYQNNSQTNSNVDQDILMDVPKVDAPPVAKPSVRTITLAGSTNKTITLVSKLLEDPATHNAFFTLISQPTEQVVEKEEIIIIDEDTNDEAIPMPPSSQQDANQKSWALYDHLNKMLNSKASVIGLVPILQNFLVTECTRIQHFHTKQFQIEESDVQNGYRVISSVFDVLSLLLLESPELMEFVKCSYQTKKTRTMESLDEESVKAWNDLGFFTHPTFHNPRILTKTRANVRDIPKKSEPNDAMYNMLLSSDFMMDDYDELRLNVRSLSTPPIITPNEFTNSSIVTTVIQMLADVPQLYTNGPIMIPILEFLRTVAWACYSDPNAQQTRQKMRRRRLQGKEEVLENDLLDQFEPLIEKDIFKQILFGNGHTTNVHIKSAVLDALLPLLQSPKIMALCKSAVKGNQTKTSLLDRITVFLNTAVTDTNDQAEIIAFRHHIVNLYSYIVFSFDDGSKILLHDDEAELSTQEVKNILPNQLILLLRKELDEIQRNVMKERIVLIQDLIRLLTVLGRTRKLNTMTSFRHDLYTVFSNLRLRSSKQDNTFENLNEESEFAFDPEILKRI